MNNQGNNNNNYYNYGNNSNYNNNNYGNNQNNNYNNMNSQNYSYNDNYYYNSNNNYNNKINNKNNKKINIEKNSKFIAQDYVVLFILYFILIIITVITSDDFKLEYLFPFGILISLIYGYYSIKCRKRYAGIIGMTIGAVIALQGSIINIILGGALTIRSFKYNKIAYNGKVAKGIIISVVISILVLIVSKFSVIADFLNYDTKLVCQKNNETLQVEFYEDGIASVKVDGNSIDYEDLVNYRLNFFRKFYSILLEEDVTKRIVEYKKIVKEYEESNGAICK